MAIAAKRARRGAPRNLVPLTHEIAAAAVEFITGPPAGRPHLLSKRLRGELASH
jgi:hypothetical protein